MLGLPDDIRACLFDMDGVLTRTADLHEAAWRRVFDGFLQARDPRQRPFTEEDYRRYVDGRPRAEGTRAFLVSRGIHLPEGGAADSPGVPTVQRLSRCKDALFLRMLAECGVQAYPGSMRYVRAAKAAGLATAVVTASVHGARVLTESGLAPLIDVCIDGVVAARDGLRGKPAPDTFLAAARAVGVTSARADRGRGRRLTAILREFFARIEPGQPFSNCARSLTTTSAP